MTNKCYNHSIQTLPSDVWFHHSDSPCHRVFAWLISVVKTACFCDGVIYHEHKRSIWVGILYAVYCSQPTGFLVAGKCSNGGELFVSTPIVNLMFVCMLLRCCKNFCSSSIPCGYMTNVHPHAYTNMSLFGELCLVPFVQNLPWSNWLLPMQLVIQSLLHLLSFLIIEFYIRAKLCGL